MNEKNILEQYVKECGLDPIEIMNRLMENGIVSDNAITLADVHKDDHTKAIKFLDGLT